MIKNHTMPGPERRRLAFIHRFTKRQRQLRHWVGFSDIALWASHVPGDALSDKDRLNRTYIDLFETMRAGDFNLANRSKVLCLQPRSKAIRLTAMHLDEVIAIFSFTDSELIESYLSRCWIPRALAADWFKRRNLPLPEHLFPSKQPPMTAQVKPKPKTRKGRYNWEQASAKISAYIHVHGIPERGDGGQAKLERLAMATFPPDRCPAESAIRTRVSAFIRMHHEMMKEAS